MEKGGRISLEDTAVIAKDQAGTVDVKNEWISGTETGAVIGGAIGLLTSFMFPIVGTVAGAVAGGWIGSKIREGVDGEFVDEVSASLEPGTSALFLILRDWNADAVAAAVRGHRGEIHHTTLSPDLVVSLQQALKAPR
ncbi:MAG: DUF1269 domain-containing protein [Thermomicrobiales bacterium]